MIDRSKATAPPDIDRLFDEGVAVDAAVVAGVRNALLRHKQLNQPIVIWQGNAPVWVAPADIAVDPLPKSTIDPFE